MFIYFMVMFALCFPCAVKGFVVYCDRNKDFSVFVLIVVFQRLAIRISKLVFI